ncbi:uncharacterized protein LOC115889941 [Sitophilus oryzae]|uniref:Uncharacterized protein LOC115889941 n=1 Tax=Sitophilus oryzae TaxID=7048 RepID=A0A6J2YSZ1_SITOR|nr:uncharacterized protein LOC115889941 [Sitophilus oryzae]
MSSRTILSRPRTKIYNSNYNIGESYYKSALDRLDRKYSGRPLSPPPRQPSAFGAEIDDRHARIFADEDLNESRRRASDRIRENHLFDSRGGRIRAADLYEDGAITNETSAALKRIRAAKKVTIVDDVDLESTSSNLKTQRLLDRSEKILDSIGINESSASRRALDNDYQSAYQKRALKVTYDADSDNLTKWSPVAEKSESAAGSAAAFRARQSRARIDDIDEEMAALQEKQAARERRVARLKQLVAECDAETVDDSGNATLSVSERIERRSAQLQ